MKQVLTAEMMFLMTTLSKMPKLATVSDWRTEFLELFSQLKIFSKRNPNEKLSLQPSMFYLLVSYFSTSSKLNNAAIQLLMVDGVVVVMVGFAKRRPQKMFNLSEVFQHNNTAQYNTLVNLETRKEEIRHSVETDKL